MSNWLIALAYCRYIIRAIFQFLTKNYVFNIKQKKGIFFFNLLFYIFLNFGY